MARWIATTLTGNSIGQFYSKASMIERVGTRLQGGERFLARSTAGTHLTLEVRWKGAYKDVRTVKSLVPNAKRRRKALRSPRVPSQMELSLP